VNLVGFIIRIYTATNEIIPVLYSKTL